MRPEDTKTCSMRVLQHTKEQIELSQARDVPHRSRLVIAMHAIRMSRARIEQNDRAIGSMWGFQAERPTNSLGIHSERCASNLGLDLPARGPRFKDEQSIRNGKGCNLQRLQILHRPDCLLHLNCHYDSCHFNAPAREDSSAG